MPPIGLTVSCDFPTRNRTMPPRTSFCPLANHSRLEAGSVGLPRATAPLPWPDENHGRGFIPKPLRILAGSMTRAGAQRIRYSLNPVGVGPSKPGVARTRATPGTVTQNQICLAPSPSRKTSEKEGILFEGEGGGEGSRQNAVDNANACLQPTQRRRSRGCGCFALAHFLYSDSSDKLQRAFLTHAQIFRLPEKVFIRPSYPAGPNRSPTRNG
jgi:hypothetical protein